MQKFALLLIPTGLLIVLALPVAQLGPVTVAAQSAPQDLFQTSDRCFACHNGLTTSTGEDISIGLAWRPTMMANAARDPYWQAGVRRETIDHPESQAAIEDECAICHMPMARYQSHYEGEEMRVFEHFARGADEPLDILARDGVSCSMCHQITEERLGTRESWVGGFVVDTTKTKGERAEYGPFDIEGGQTRVMRSSSGGYEPTKGEHVRKSELCATCHTLITTALGPGGEAIGELPEQMPYQEWYASEFRDTQSCQECHMPLVEEETRIAVTLGRPQESMGRHVFVGGNFFMLRMLNSHRNELGVWALPTEFEAAADRTIQHLQSEVAKVTIDAVSVAGGRLDADVSIENMSGHKFPTAYPSRRAWLHVTVKDGNDQVIFESGALNPDGSIDGNDNDADPLRFEPHYTAITDPAQVQIYEDIMVGPDDVPTTGLLTAVRFIKDNRLLPRGFDKRAVEQEIASQGASMADDDFTGGGDTIRYSVDLGDAQGPFQVKAELWFQPISYRWANNLRPYDAAEPQRFVGYYDEMSSGSGLLLTSAEATR